MTKYKSVSNGYYSFLFYEKEKRFIFFKYKVWERVWKPYYDHIWERMTGEDNLIYQLY